MEKTNPKKLMIVKRRGNNSIVYSDREEQFTVSEGITDLYTAKKCLTVERRELKKLGYKKYKEEYKLF